MQPLSDLNEWISIFHNVHRYIVMRLCISVFSLCSNFLCISLYWIIEQTFKHTSHQHNGRPFFNYCILSWRYWPPSTLHWLLVWGTPLEINTHWQCWFPCVMVSKVDFYIFWRKYVRVCLSKTHYHVSCLCVQRDFLHIAMWLLAGPSQKCFFKWFILFVLV